MVHELKIRSSFFEAVQAGTKTFELRKNDRDFKVGDKLILKEWDYELIERFDNGEEKWSDPHYTGREIEKDITYILKGGILATQGSGLRKGYAILGIK